MNRIRSAPTVPTLPSHDRGVDRCWKGQLPVLLCKMDQLVESMSSEKISHNADVVLSTLDQFDEPASMRMIARASGSRDIKQLEKHQVRTAIESHLREEFVQAFMRTEKGNEVEYFIPTTAGAARAELHLDDRLEQLEKFAETVDEYLQTLGERIDDRVDKRIQNQIHE